MGEISIADVAKWKEEIDESLEGIKTACDEAIKPLSAVYPLVEEEQTQHLDELMELHTNLALAMFDFQNFSFLVHRLKGQLEGPRMFSESMSKGLVDFQKEIAYTIQAVKTLHFAVKERVAYIRYRIGE